MDKTTEKWTKAFFLLSLSVILCLMTSDIDKDPFEEYYKETEPDKAGRGYAWSTAIGLQQVDGLKPSEYLVKTAIENIEGRITIKEAQGLIESYYNERSFHLPAGDRTEEADKVSARIAEILSEDSFTLSPAEYLSIHRRLFQGIYKFAGTIRDYNITKKEWVLDGESVLYGSASELRATLEYDIDRERNFDARGMSMDEIIHHLALFVAGLWQIHIFGEGNTRTTAVFFIKYLRSLGFSATNDTFARNSWYFRNALVRANYTNLMKGIYPTTEYLERFMRNLLLGENNELHNRSMHVSGKMQVEEKTDYSKVLADCGCSFTHKTTMLISKLFDAFGYDRPFGRKDVMEMLDLKHSGAFKLIILMVDNNLIDVVSGHGWKRYMFRSVS